MNSRRCRAGVAVLDGLIYGVGGFNGSLRVRTVDVYDMIKDQWRPVASTEARRSTLGAAVLNGLIYAVGGKFKHLFSLVHLRVGGCHIGIFPLAFTKNEAQT